jgi:hypothetical protein
MSVSEQHDFSAENKRNRGEILTWAWGCPGPVPGVLVFACKSARLTIFPLLGGPPPSMLSNLKGPMGVVAIGAIAGCSAGATVACAVSAIAPY